MQGHANISKVGVVPKRNYNLYYRFIKYLKKTVFYLVLIFYSVLCLYPIYFSLISSVKKNVEIFNNPFMFPTQFHFENYKRAWEVGKVGIYFKNSVVLTLSTLFVAALVGTFAAYILSRYEFKLKSFVYVFFTAGMMIPIQTTIIPLSYMFGKFKLIDNYPVLILLFTAFNLSMTVFILTGFMKGIPKELEEAAVIDGCSAFRIYSSIMLPLSMPAIATVSIFNFLHTWNNLLYPLVFISKDSLKTISIGLLTFFAERTSDYGGVMAAVVITMLPPIIAYILLQEKVEKGLTAGAVKG
ncbi:MAG: raffinose/stachyose/melibiose transport system permease protein [Petroclostridium sp.]|jgi:raffinose/stachyose/melibiose transport system permease protein|nr:araQ 29 [Clostridia bacterium]MDK2811325.1 raffinose/stachyose/melibiose transport system permease protein [Petroclostridium sp.]